MLWSAAATGTETEDAAPGAGVGITQLLVLTRSMLVRGDDSWYWRSGTDEGVCLYQVLTHEVFRTMYKDGLGAQVLSYELLWAVRY